MEHFADHCATCHAHDGSGDTLFGKGFYPKPPDIRQKETRNEWRKRPFSKCFE
jgi:mono/diheme cytochrome c family protein